MVRLDVNSLYSIDARKDENMYYFRALSDEDIHNYSKKNHYRQ